MWSSFCYLFMVFIRSFDLFLFACLQVFEPVVGKDLKISAEEIETALINANTLLAHLHITLLKVFIAVIISHWFA